MKVRISDSSFTVLPEPSILPLHSKHSVYLLYKWMTEYVKIKPSQMPLKALSTSSGVSLGNASEENELRLKLEEGI